LLALLGAHHIFHVSGVRVKELLVMHLTVHLYLLNIFGASTWSVQRCGFPCQNELARNSGIEFDFKW
jgi:hypothetical protein